MAGPTSARNQTGGMITSRLRAAAGTVSARSADVQPAAAGSLWRHSDFLKLWAGQTISLAGSQVTTLALPLTAVLVLGASPLQMGVLQAMQYAPFLIVSLFAGVWIDRRRRRTLLIGTDWGRAILLGSIPAVLLLGGRWIEYLYAVAFGVGILTVVFNVAYQAHLPSLVARNQLVEGNSKLEASRSITQVAGPGLGGMFVQLFSPPVAIIIDALSFVVSAVSLCAIQAPEPEPKRRQRDARAELREGFAFITAHPLLRLIVGSTAIVNLGYAMAFAVYILFLSRDLAIHPVLLGAILAIGGIGGLIGAATARRVVLYMGFGRTVAAAIGLLGVALLAVSLAGTLPVPSFPLVALAEGLMSFGIIVYNVSQFTLWQTTTPTHLQGRVSATLHFIIWGALPVGALAGGLVGSALSLRWVIGIAAAGIILAAVWIALSVMRLVSDQEAAAAFAQDS